MNTLEMLEKRNQEFAVHQFTAGLPPVGTLKTMIISCVDARVDPAHILGLEPGDAMVIRSIGGRVTPATLQTISMLLSIGANPGNMTLIVLHHTQCGITRMVGKPDTLADYFQIDTAELATKAILDPRAAVAVDVAVLKTNPLTSEWDISGLVYDVNTGLVETVVAPDSL
ncbi:carbonic anhydrase [Dictyobacter alpinus]|uniref:carbonic anhydrase n=1 Tax=Dictyobacter alpinus TaxID=2014873 RepID=A0A402BE92_9CHLR|nr:carbonic anhydrase [Dictyobacter alpinus]GCE29612.1 carbonic anhydrase [Dictyobacter alpinus]